VNASFDGADIVERKPSRANHEASFISASKGKGEKFRRVTQFRESGTTVTQLIDHSLLDQSLTGK